MKHPGQMGWRHSGWCFHKKVLGVGGAGKTQRGTDTKGDCLVYWSLSTWNRESLRLVATVSWCNQQVPRALTFHDM